MIQGLVKLIYKITFMKFMNNEPPKKSMAKSQSMKLEKMGEPTSF